MVGVVVGGWFWLSVEGGGWFTTGYWWLMRATVVDIWWLQKAVEGGWLMVVDGSGIVVMGVTMVD
ncbi:hypothetical protein HanIR_Chr02g0082761 [Helianthus annuus]|nr:hypothetical protein HanIR_Chr02g0082761 [Helianthus annuus]